MITSLQVKGFNYEKQVKFYLQTKTKQTYLWKDIPENELRKSGLLGNWNEHRFNRKNNKINNLPDLGTDILLKDLEKNTYELIQCKNYAKNNVCIEDLGGFYSMILHYDLPGSVYYNSDLSNNIKLLKSIDKVKFVKYLYDENLVYDEIIDKKVISKNKNIDKPFYYQIEAYEKLKDCNRSILSLPCGMGKTLISIIISKNYDNIILVSPLIAHAEQNLENYEHELNGFGYNSIFVSCEGIRNEDEILMQLNSNVKNIISFTYKSVDILANILSSINNCIIVIDEFHNLSKNDILDETSDFYQILHSNSKILFMSATPKFLNLDNTEYENEEIFGKDNYTFSMCKAISENHICDYEIFLPDIKNKNNLNDILKEGINVSELNIDLISKTKYIMRGMLETGSKKCFIYLRNHKEVIDMIKIFNKLNDEYYFMDIYIDKIISDTKKDERKYILDKFSNFDGYSIIYSVEILDESIDCPICDSIFITYPSESKIRNIQRMCRANRKNSFNVHKKANIFLWCDEFSDISIFISHLKTFDESFVETKVLILNTFENEGCILPRDSKNKQIYTDMDNYIISIRKFGYGIDTWKQNLDNLKTFIKKYGVLPSIKKEDEKYLSHWYYDQNNHFKNNIDIMKVIEIKVLWEDFLLKFNEYFKKDPFEIWHTRLSNLESFISQFNRLPSQSSSETEEAFALAKWVVRNNDEYNKNIKAMKDESIRNEWIEFKNKFSQFFNQKASENIQEWTIKYNTFKQFVIDNQRLPYENKSKSSEYELRIWFKSSLKVYEKNKFENSNDKKLLFEELIPLVNQFMNILTNFEIWQQNLKSLEEYIIKYGKLPPEKVNINPLLKGIDKEIMEKNKALGIWKSNFIQDLKSEFKTFCMDIDLSKISTSEKSKVEKKIDKFKKEDAEIKEVLSHDYSKLNKIQKTKYDKYKQKLIDRDKEIELMREESSNKFFLYNELKCKFENLF